MKNPTFDPDIASLIRAMLAVTKNERTLPLVTAGLDPAVHADSPQTGRQVAGPMKLSDIRILSIGCEPRVSLRSCGLRFFVQSLRVGSVGSSAAIKARTIIVQAELDRYFPPADAKYEAQHIPNVPDCSRHCECDGTLIIVTNVVTCGLISLTEGRIPDAILYAERARCARAVSQTVPGRL